MKKAILLTLILTLFSSFSWASEPPPKAAAVPLTQPKIPLPNTPPATRAAWIEQMQKNLPPLLCHEDQYFITCFETTKQACIDLTKVLVDACLNNAKILIPENLDSQGEYFGQMIGHCSYDLYEQLMQSKKRSSANCQRKAEPSAQPKK